MTNLSPERQYAMLRRMITIRRFEEIASEKFRAGDIYGVVHAYSGEEAVAVGVCEALRDGDQIISTYRGHGHCIAKGADLNRMMAELYGRADGYCKGKGGSMHIADFSIGMLGANGIVAGGISIITGAGLASQMDDKGAVAVGFFGDGASNAGPFHESINIAASWKLPVVYVCENNQWAVNVPAEESVATPNVADRAQGYGIPGVIVDGNDVYAVHNAAVDAVARARAGQGPTLIEAKTYRHRRHTERLDQPDARPPEQIEAWLQEDKDPIARMISLLQSQSDLLSNERLEELKTIVEEDLATAVSFAEKSPFPSKESALEDVFSGLAK